MKKHEKCFFSLLVSFSLDVKLKVPASLVNERDRKREGVKEFCVTKEIEREKNKKQKGKSTK